MKDLTSQPNGVIQRSQSHAAQVAASKMPGIASRLLTESLKHAQRALARLGAGLHGVRSLQGTDPLAGPARAAHLALISVALDQFAAPLKTALDIAQPGGADGLLIQQQLRTMRATLSQQAVALRSGELPAQQFWPAAEVLAGSVLGAVQMVARSADIARSRSVDSAARPEILARDEALVPRFN